MSLTHYELGKSEFSSNDWEIIKQIMKRWQQESPLGKLLVKNLEQEHFLAFDSYISILKCLLSNQKTETSTLENEYRNSCYSHTLKGEKAVFPNNEPVFFCTAVEEEDFARYLQEVVELSTGDAFPEDEALKFIDSLSKSGGLPPSFGSIKLKKYLLWSSWNHENTSGPPFQFVKFDDADEVRINHALIKANNPAKKLLLFTYKIPASIVKYRPTIADAGKYPYFSPAPLSETNHGWTSPWDKETKYEKFDVKPRPEVIHESITFSELVLPIKILTTL